MISHGRHVNLALQINEKLQTDIILMAPLLTARKFAYKSRNPHVREIWNPNNSSSLV